MQDAIDKSGLVGLTFSGNHIEAYYVGDPTDPAAFSEFERGFDRAVAAVGADGAGTRRSAARLWRYGHGFDESDTWVVPYADIADDVHPRAAQESATARRIAERHADREVAPAR